MSEMTLSATRISPLKIISVSVLLAWILPAHALSLGKFQVQSAMGEPLRAEVEVTQFTPEELRGLQAQLASPSAFRQAGMEYNSALNGVVARVENRSDGRPVIVLNGRSPVQESFIDLILEAQWSTGRAVKNYALLLNSASSSGSGVRQTALNAPTPIQPEVIASPVTLARSALPSPSAITSTADGALTPSSVEVNTNQVPVYRFDSLPAAGAAPMASPMAVAASSMPMSSAKPRIETYAANHGNGMTVQPGDTASNLIMGHMPANVSQDQMLLALVRANPNAFIEGNVNLVRAGSVLRMPQASEATQISRAEARQTVIAQNRDFAAYARRVAESPLLVGAAQSREMSGSVTTKTEESAASSAKQDKLTLSKAQVGDNSAEAKLAAEREAKDANKQLSDLNKNLEDLQALAKDPKTTAPEVTSTSSVPLDESSWMSKLSQDKSIWAWVLGALLAVVALVVWSSKKNGKSSETFAPSYDDVPSQPMAPSGSPVNIPPQITDIDLNLNSKPVQQTSAPAQAPAQTAQDVTEHNKLALASQLLASGDKDLARTLIKSVASTANGDLKARAMQMLGQIA